MCACVRLCLYFPEAHPGHILCHKWLWKTDHIDIISRHTVCLQFNHWKKGQKSRTETGESRQPLNIMWSHGLILHYSWTNTVRMLTHLFQIKRTCKKGGELLKTIQVIWVMLAESHVVVIFNGRKMLWNVLCVIVGGVMLTPGLMCHFCRACSTCQPDLDMLRIAVLVNNYGCL